MDVKVTTKFKIELADGAEIELNESEAKHIFYELKKTFDPSYTYYPIYPYNPYTTIIGTTTSSTDITITEIEGE